MALYSHGIEMIPSHELLKLKNKRVLDISAGTGTSSKFLKKYCGDLSATEARTDSFSQKDIPISFLNVEDISSLEDKIKDFDVAVSCGLFYHLQSHWNILKSLCTSNLEYFFIETLCGPESPNPQMWWALEDTDYCMNAYSSTEKKLMHGTPNLVWLNDAVNSLDASITCLVRRYEEWRTKSEPNCRWRMMLKVNLRCGKGLDIKNNLWKNQTGCWLI